MINLPVGYQSRLPLNNQRPRVTPVGCPILYYDQAKTTVLTPGVPSTTRMFAYMQIAQRQESIRR